jgi:hypothetical protein
LPILISYFELNIDGLLAAAVKNGETNALPSVAGK